MSRGIDPSKSPGKRGDCVKIKCERFRGCVKYFFVRKMCNLNFLLIISSVMVQAKCVGERENGFGERKRFDVGLETCIENFDVHVDKIIRTQDSRAMGAKYLSEAEVNTRDDCTKLCCETPTCDVFVFEQKVPGSCYLFHCGSPEDFKCKFTQHRNYTSAVLALNNRPSELEDGVKLTKHEEELNMLRKIDSSAETTTFLPLSTKVPATPAQPKRNSTKSQCSRYQFECRGSGECIAIYNACDGIPQCSDGSDEAPELYCPYVTGTSRPKTFHEQLKNLKEANENAPRPDGPQEFPAPSEPPQKMPPPAKASAPPRRRPSASALGRPPYGYSQNEQTAEASRHEVDPSRQLSAGPRYYGREGEIVQYPAGGAQWQGYLPQVQEESGRAFNRKGSGPESSDSQYPPPYGNEFNHAEYLKYAAAAANGGYYGGGGPAYYPGPNGWPRRVPQQPHGLEDVPRRLPPSAYGNALSASGPSDYYYEDSQLRSRFLPAPQDPRALQPPDDRRNPPAKHPDADETGRELARAEEPKKKESVKKTLEKVAPAPTKTSPRAEATTTAAAADPKPPPGVAEGLKMSEGDVDGINERPSGAILSLTLGMCITAIMITLVGCRLRVVRKRMRRSGKSPYAHDADFLVNGMYL